MKLFLGEKYCCYIYVMNIKLLLCNGYSLEIWMWGTLIFLLSWGLPLLLLLIRWQWKQCAVFPWTVLEMHCCYIRAHAVANKSSPCVGCSEEIVTLAYFPNMRNGDLVFVWNFKQAAHPEQHHLLYTYKQSRWKNMYNALRQFALCNTNHRQHSTSLPVCKMRRCKFHHAPDYVQRGKNIELSSQVNFNVDYIKRIS